MDEIDKLIQEEEGITPKTIPAPKDEIDQAIEEEEADQDIAFNTAVMGGIKQTPDRQAEYRKLSDKLQVPSSFVERNYDSIKQSLAKEEFRKAKETNPSLGAWIDSPSKAGLVQDDLDNVKKLDSNAGRFKVAESDPYGYLGTAGRQIKSGHLEVESGMLLYMAANSENPEQYIDSIIENQKKLAEMAGKIPKDYEKFLAEYAGESEEASKKWKDFTDYWSENKEADLLERFSNISEKGGSAIGEALDIGALILKNPVDFLTQMSQSSARMAYPMIATIPSSIAGATTGAMAGASLGGLPGAAAGGLIGGGTGAVAGMWSASAALEYTGSLKEFLSKDHKVDFSNRDSILKALKNPEIAKEVKEKAQRRAITMATVQTIFSALSFGAGKTALSPQASLGNKLASGGKAIMIEGASEGVEETAGQLAAEKGDISKLDIGELTGEFMGGAMLFGLGGGISYTAGTLRDQMSKSTPEAIGQVSLVNQKVNEAKDSAANLQELAVSYNESKLKGRDAEAASEIINSASGKASVLFQAEEWVDHWKALGEDPVAKADELLPGGRADLTKSQDEGSPLRVTVGDFITKFSEEPSFNDLIKKSRRELGAFNVVEAETVGAKIPDLIKQLGKESREEIKFRNTNKEKLAAIEDEISTQVKAAGRDSKEAKAMSMLYSRLVSNTARVTGKSVEEVHAARPLRIQSAEEAQGLMQNEMAGFSFKADESLVAGAEKITEVDKVKLNPLKGADNVKKNLASLKQYLNKDSTVGEFTLPAATIKNFLDRATERTLPDMGAVDKKAIRRSQAKAATEAHVIKNLPALLQASVPVIKTKKGTVKRYAVGSIEGVDVGVKFEVAKDGKVVDIEVASQAASQTLGSSEAPTKVSLAEFQKIVNAGRSNKDLKLFQKEAIEYINKDSLGFYSKLKNEVEKMDFKQVPAKDLAARLPKIVGIKPEELEWSGILDFLKGVEGKVTKEEVLSFLEKGGVQLEEVVLGADTSVGGGTYTITGDEGDFFINEVEDMGDIGQEVAGPFETEIEAEREMENLVAGRTAKPTGDTKYSKYTLPGGENYREVLLTLPLRNFEEVPTPDPLSYEESVALKEEKDLLQDEVLSSELSEGDKRLKLDRLREIGAILNAERDTTFQQRKNKEKTNYQSSHWDEDNVLAHFRLNDRTSPDGKKVLFIEEIQSDWHQAGRKKGYKGQGADKLKALEEAETAFQNYVETLKAKYGNAGAFRDWTPQEQLEHKRLNDEVNFYISDGRRPGINEVPDAPFKNTETWALLAFKRILNMAALQGYDQVSWAPGQVHAERYDLSKQVRSITYVKTEEGKYNLYILDSRGNELPTNKSYTPEELEDTVGKEITKKIVDGEGENFGENSKKLSGIDLKVGGEGMIGFYDKLLPKAVQKYVSKLDKESRLIKDTVDTALITQRIVGEKRLQESWTLPLTDKLKEEVLKGQVLFQQDEQQRGSLQPTSTELLMSYLKDANKSTGLHEMGHVYLEHMKETVKYLQTLGELNDTQKNFMKDVETTIQTLGINSLEDVQVEQHELFARLFEAYLMEGKAPSKELQSLFNNFKTWLVNIYKSILGIERSAGFKVNLTDQMREVFDRILISDEEVKSVNDNMGYSAEEMVSLFNALGVKDQDAVDSLLLAHEEARLEAERIMYQKNFKQLKNKETKEYKDYWKEIEATMLGRLAASPLYKAWEDMKSSSVKFKTEQLKNYMTPQEFKAFPRSLYSSEGLDPALIADNYGFSSAKEFVNAIKSNPSLKEAVRLATQAEVDKRYPNYLAPDQDTTLKKEALDAVTNEKRAQALRLEFDIMLKNFPTETKKLIEQTTRLPSTKDLKDRAEKMVSRLSYREANPVEFRRIETKSRRDSGAQLVRGQLENSLKSKLKEMLNHELGKAAQDKRDAIDKRIAKMQERLKKSDAELVKRGHLDMFKAAQSVLGKFNLLTDVQAEKLEVYLRQLKAYDPMAYGKVEGLTSTLIDVTPKEFKSLSMEELENIMDVAEALYSLAKDEKMILVDGKKVEKEKAIAELSSHILAMPGERIKKVNTVGKLWKAVASSSAANMTRVEHLLTRLDGGKAGPFTKYLWNRANDGQTEYTLKLGEYFKKINTILEGHFKGLLKDETEIDLSQYFQGIDPDLQMLSKSELIMSLLHSGNDSNKRKLLLGRSWGSEDFDGELITKDYDAFIKDMMDKGVITKEVMDGVQKIWDLFEELKPQIQKTHKDVYGYFFKEIEAKPVKTPWGIYRGGYAPAVTDPLIVQAEAKRRNELSTEQVMNQLTFAHTPKGFTKERVDSYNKALSLDLKLIRTHVEKSIRFIALEGVVTDLNRIVNNRAFSAALDERSNFWGNEILIPWLAKIATQQTEKPADNLAWRYLSKGIGFLRRNANAQLMFMNVVNTVENLSDIPALFTKVKIKSFNQALKRYVGNAKILSNMVKDASPYMRERMEDQIFEINDTYRDLTYNSSKFQKIQDQVNKHTYVLQKSLQNVVDVVAWSAAFDERLAAGDTELQAVRHADSVVRTIFGASRPIDLANIEMGGALQKLLLSFYGYFLNKGNLFYYATPKQKAKFYALGLMAPAILSALIRRAMKGEGLDEDEDEEYIDDAFDIMVMSQVKYNAAIIPFGGNMYKFIEGQFTGQTYDDRLSISPLIGMIEASKGVTNLMTKDELRSRDIRDAMNFFGTVTGLPMGAPARPIGFMIDMEQGKQKAENPLDYSRGLLTGKSGKK